jgi:GNAT superfamily N-acetyltransferase
MAPAATPLTPDVAIEAVGDAHGLAHVRSLFIEYVEWLNEDLAFQGFGAEMDGLPGEYSPPGGALLLARVDGSPAGAVGLRPLGDGICEMKRMYVRAPWRSLKLGRRLAEDVIGAARRIGYRAMRLDTLERLTAANALYRSLGFRRIEAYYHNPLEGVRFYELDLTDTGGTREEP